MLITTLLRVEGENHEYSLKCPPVDNEAGRLIGLGLLYESDWCPDHSYDLSIWKDQTCIFSQRSHEAFSERRLDDVLAEFYPD